MPRKRIGVSTGKGLKRGTARLAAPVPFPANPTKDREYEAEDDFRTLSRAEEVRGDASRHGRALAHGRKKISAMSRVVSKSGTVRPVPGQRAERAVSPERPVRAESRGRVAPGGRR